MTARIRKPFALDHLRPPALHDDILNFEWDMRRLWALDLPSTTMDISELTWHLELPTWAWNGVPFAVTPNQVLADPERYPEQHARILASDLRFPLHVLDRPGRLRIMDGLHRLAHARHRHHKEVSVKKVPLDRLDDIAIFINASPPPP